MIKEKLLLVNPFVEAFIHSDFLGKLIFIGLITLSIITWIIVIYKVWLTSRAKKLSRQFAQKFSEKKSNPLSLEAENSLIPFKEIYLSLKKASLEIISKNQRFNQSSHLSPADIDLIQTHLQIEVASQKKHLESWLFILAMVVSLAPFLGLLGTVWGILTTFSQLQAQSGGAHHMVLSGLSLALATTVLGLIDAIPALIGYSYLKNCVLRFETDMERFAQEILASVELQYRKVD